MSYRVAPTDNNRISYVCNSPGTFSLSTIGCSFWQDTLFGSIPMKYKGASFDAPYRAELDDVLGYIQPDVFERRTTALNLYNGFDSLGISYLLYPSCYTDPGCSTPPEDGIYLFMPATPRIPYSHYRTDWPDMPDMPNFLPSKSETFITGFNFESQESTTIKRVTAKWNGGDGASSKGVTFTEGAEGALGDTIEVITGATLEGSELKLTTTKVVVLKKHGTGEEITIPVTDCD